MVAQTPLKLKHNTNKYSFEIEIFCKKLEVSEFLTEKERFTHLCKDGCRNFNRKYSCPPLSPEFNQIAKNFKYAHVFFYKVDLAEYPQTYNSIRMVNAVVKSKQRKLTNRISKKLTQEGTPHRILENGSCRLCKKCAYTSKEPCKHPDKMRYSLEATGVDVNELCLTCFGMSLQWYKKGEKYPEYQGVVSAVLCESDKTIVSDEDFLSS